MVTTGVSGSSKIQTLMIFIEHVSIKVGVANTHWVIYALVSFIPCMFVDEDNLRFFPLL